MTRPKLADAATEGDLAMTVPITPDERAAMRERYTVDPPSAWDTSAAAHGRALRDLGTSARADVPRLLDALDTAEASLRSRSDLIARLQQGKRFADGDVKRLRRERDEARSAAVIAAPARPAPAWDEDTVQAEVLGIDARHHFHGTACLCGFDSHGRARSATEHITSAVLAAVRRHLPVRPDRETVARAIHAAHRPTTGATPAWDAEDPAWRQTYLDFADAVLARWPGESRATVQAAALHDAADAAVSDSDDCIPWDHDHDRATVATWLRARADRLEKGADRG